MSVAFPVLTAVCRQSSRTDGLAVESLWETLYRQFTGKVPVLLNSLDCGITVRDLAPSVCRQSSSTDGLAGLWNHCERPCIVSLQAKFQYWWTRCGITVRDLVPSVCRQSSSTVGLAGLWNHCERPCTIRLQAKSQYWWTRWIVESLWDTLHRYQRTLDIL